MRPLNRDIQIISAPSILGLKPTGVEELGTSLLQSGLSQALHANTEIVHTDTLNDQYSRARDPLTNVLNPELIRRFSITLGDIVTKTMADGKFPFILGGDCSIAIAVAAALKAQGKYGLYFFDAHADFYSPDKSVTGEVADMDLAIVTGRGPDVLTDINNLRPYLDENNVIHIGQRDQEEALRYEAQDIRDTSIKCFSLREIQGQHLDSAVKKICAHARETAVRGFWIHFDTDVLADEINPAVDYRLPGGLQFQEVEYIMHSLMQSTAVVGIDVTIFNPRLDVDGEISRKIVESLGRTFSAL
jgi:arginase